MKLLHVLCAIGGAIGGAALAVGGKVGPKDGLEEPPRGTSSRNLLRNLLEDDGVGVKNVGHKDDVGGAGAIEAARVRGLVGPCPSPPTPGRAAEEVAARFPFDSNMVGLSAAVTPATAARPRGAILTAATGAVPSLLESSHPPLGPVAAETAATFRPPTRYNGNNFPVRGDRRQETAIPIQPDYISDHDDVLLHVDAPANRKLESINPTFQGKLVPTDGAEDDRFGDVVAIYGNKVIVGSGSDDDKGRESGSAYIYAHDGTTWVEEAKLVPADGGFEEKFGRSVAMYGNKVIVGCDDKERGARSGSVYIYAYDGTSWGQESKLIPADAAVWDHFGYAVAMYGNKVIVGTPYDDDKAFNAGSAYIYAHDGTSWVLEAKLLPTDLALGDLFGTDVAMYGNKVIVSSPSDDDKGDFSGSAYIYAHDGTTWIEEAKLVPTDGAENDYFGDCVDIYGNKVVVGVAGDDDKGAHSGSAYIYAYDGGDWVQEAKLVPSDGKALATFGNSVAIYGDKVIVGAEGNDDKGVWSGAVYIYAYDGSDWVQEAKFVPTDGVQYGHFGHTVSIYGDKVIVGSHGDDDKGGNSGSAYIWGGLGLAAPTSPQSTAPTNNPTSTNSPTFSPIKAPWEIQHTATESNFTSSNPNGTITTKFLIGKERNHTESTFAGECDPLEEEGTAIDPGIMTTHVAVEVSDSPTMDELTVRYEFDMDLVAGSNVYDDNTNTIKFCQQVELVQYLEDGSDFVIAQQLTNVAVTFNLTAGFTIDIDLDKAEVNEANGTANLDSFISAIHCDGSEGMNKLLAGTKIKPNDDLDICVLSSSSDVEIEEIASMTIQGKKRDGTVSSLAVVAEGLPFIPAITYFSYQTATGIAVRTRVPTNAFNFEAKNATISVVGSVALKLKGGRRRLADGAGSATRDLQAAAADEGVASFDLSVSIEPEESSVGDGFGVTASSAKNAPGHKSLPVLAALVASTLAVIW